MQTVIGIIVGLVVLTLLIVLHEYGHFRAARRNGVRVLEFAVGFGPHIDAWVVNPDYLKWKSSKKSANSRPPRLLKLPRSEWKKPQKTLIISINWLPLGGFCQMDGESDADERKGTFGSVSFWAKTKILFAGVAMNWLTAFVIFTILAWTGMPQFVTNQFKIDSDTVTTGDSRVTVVEVIDDTPAKAAGFQSGDILLSALDEESWRACSNADPESCTSKTDLTVASAVTEFNSAHAGQKVFYVVKRNQCDCPASDCNQSCFQTTVVETTLNPTDATYLLGVKMGQSGQILYRSTWSAPLVGAGTTVQLTVETYKGIASMLGNLFSGLARQFSPDNATREAGREAIGAAGDSVSGPIGIIGVLFPAFTSAGATNLAFLAALISVSLACMNVLPIPALDGGRWLLIAIARLRGKKLKKETEEKIVSRAFIALLILFGLICVLDILRLV